METTSRDRDLASLASAAPSSSAAPISFLLTERVDRAQRDRNTALLADSLHDGFLLGKRCVLTDRDPLYTEGFREILRRGGVNVLKLPAESPNLNAFAERFVLSIRSECLDRIVPLGEAHLRRALCEYVRHYHEERNHQGLDNALIVPGKAMDGTGTVVRRDRLGGLLSFYYRDAA